MASSTTPEVHNITWNITPYLILAYWPHAMKTQRHPQNRKYLTCRKHTRTPDELLYTLSCLQSRISSRTVFSVTICFYFSWIYTLPTSVSTQLHGRQVERFIHKLNADASILLLRSQVLRWMCLLVCLSVCLSVGPLAYLRKCMAEFHQIFVLVSYGYGSVFLWRRCDMLCTAGVVDDALFSPVDLIVCHVYC